jgi:hypothetical protein
MGVYTEPWFVPMEIFCKASEGDRVIGYVVHLSTCRVMIWVRDGLAPIPNTLIIRSCNDGFANLECLFNLSREPTLSLDLRMV